MDSIRSANNENFISELNLLFNVFGMTQLYLRGRDWKRLGLVEYPAIENKERGTEIPCSEIKLEGYIPVF